MEAGLPSAPKRKTITKQAQHMKTPNHKKELWQRNRLGTVSRKSRVGGGEEEIKLILLAPNLTH